MLYKISERVILKEDFKEFIERVRSAANIVEVIGGYVSLKKRGTKHWACCPFHGEKTPSFSVDENKQLFYCFGCHLGGDVFKFVQQKENINFIEAVKRLAEHYNIPVPERDKSPEDLQREKEFQRIYEINDWAAKYFAACLNHEKVGVAAKDYLNQRGITLDIIKDFQIGYAQNNFESLVDALNTKAINYTEMIKAGLALEGKSSKPYDKFRNRIMIPIKNPRGKIVGFGGRILGSGEPKYLNTAETYVFNKRYLLFGFDLAQKPMREKGYAIIVEGYMDAISLHAAGFRNVVASMGTAFSEQQAAILRRNIPKVIFCYDSDNAGRNASIRAASLAKAANLEVKVAVVPGAKDPDEFVRAQGSAAYQKVLDEAIDGLEFQINETLTKFDLTNVTNKIEAIKELSKFFSECQNEIEVQNEIKKLAQRLTIDESLITDEYHKLQKFKKRQYNDGTSPPTTIPSITVINPTEKLLLALILQDVNLLLEYRQKLKELDWQSPNLQKIYKLICEYVDTGQDLGGLSDDLDDEQKSLLAILHMENMPINDKEKILHDCLRDLTINQLERRYALHAGLAAEYEKSGDSRLLDELKLCQEIRNEIKELCKK